MFYMDSVNIMPDFIPVLIPLIFALVLFVVGIKYLWTYLVVRLFPGAVEEKLIIKDISWKISIILAIILLLIK